MVSVLDICILFTSILYLNIQVPALKEAECVLSGPLLSNECFHYSLMEALFELLYYCSRRTVGLTTVKRLSIHLPNCSFVCF